MKDPFDPLASVALVKNFEFAEDLRPGADLFLCVLEGVSYQKGYINLNWLYRFVQAIFCEYLSPGQAQAGQ